MEDKDQQEFFIQQLKDLLRANEIQLQQRERELEECNAKFQKFRLQSKAKLQQLSSKVKAQDAQAARESSSPDTEATVEDASGSSKSTDSSEQSLRARMLMLKRQLEETRLQFQKKEHEMENSKKSLETMVEQLQSQLLQRDQIIIDLRAGGDSPQASVPVKKQELSSMEENKLYAQMVYKDSKILELNNQITELEGKIMDLQENLKEKDEVLQTRNKAIQLMTGDLSLRNKAAVDDLDDTRAEMRNMQQDFLTRESSWQEERAHLEEQLAVAQTHLLETQESLQKLEATRFNLAARNAELQQKVVIVQEAFEKHTRESEKALQEKLDAMSKELEEKKAELETVQTKLKETVSQNDAKVLKARAMERRRAKALERELEQLKKGMSSDEALTSLQQQVAELEEEKGAIQLKMLEMEEAMSIQAASRLEGMEQKESTIAELESQVKAAQHEKISLEMRAAEFEEQREIAERRMQSIQQELEALRNSAETPLPHLDAEIKMAHEEELKKLNATHVQDEIVIAELKEKLRHQQEVSKELKQNLEELREEYNNLEESLQIAQKCIEEKNIQVENLTKIVSELEETISKDQEEKEKLHMVLKGKTEEVQKVLEELGVSSVEEASSRIQTMSSYKAQCEILNEEIKAKMSENQELASRADKLLKANQDLENLRTQLRSVEECFQYLSVTSADEIKAKWDSVQQDTENYKSALTAMLSEQSSKIEMLAEAVAQKEEFIQSLSKELKKLQEENHTKDFHLSEVKISLENAEKEISIVRESTNSEGEKVKSRIASLLEQNSDLEGEVSRLQEELEEKNKLATELEVRLQCLTTHAEHLKSKMQKLECDCKAKQEAMEQEFERLRLDHQNSMEAVESYQLTVGDLEKKLAVANENLARVMSSSEQQIRRLEERVADTHADLQAKCTENLNFESRLAKSEEEHKAALEMTGALSARLNELQDSEKLLIEKLNAADTAHSEVMSRLQAETEKTDTITKQLEGIASERLNFEKECVQLREALSRMQDGTQQALHERYEIEQNFSEVTNKNLELASKNDDLLKKVEELQSQLHEQEIKSNALVTELQEIVARLNREKKELVEQCDHLAEEREMQNAQMQEFNSSFSEASTKLENANKQNEQLKTKYKKAAKELTETRSKLKEVEAVSSAQHTKLTAFVELLQNEKHSIESTCTRLEYKLSEYQEEIDKLRSITSETENGNECLHNENLQLKQQISELLQECDDLKQQCHNVVTTGNSRIQELKDTIDLSQTERTELEMQCAELQASNKTLSQEVAAVRMSLQDASLENEQLKQLLKESQSEVAHARQDLLALSKELEDAQHTKIEAEEKCAQLQASVMEKQREIDDAVLIIRDTKTKLDSMYTEHEHHEVEKKELLSQLSALQSWQSRTEATLQEAEQEKNCLLASERKLQEVFETKSQKLNEIQVMLSSREAELNALKNNVETEQSQLLIKMSEQTQVMERQAGELELVKSELSACRDRLTAVHQDLTHHKERLQAAEQANQEILEEMGTLRVKVEEASEQVALKDDSLQKMSDKKELLKETVEKLTAEKIELQERLQKMVELEEQCSSSNFAAAELDKQVKEKSATIEQLLTDLDEAKKALHHLATVCENRVKELEGQVEGYKPELERLHNSEHALQDEVALLKEQKLQVDKVVEEMNKQCHVTAEELKVSSELTTTLQSELEKTRAEFLETKHKLEEEVFSYAAKVDAHNKHSHTLEAQLDSLEKEKQKLEDELQKSKEEIVLYKADLAGAIAVRDHTIEQYEAACETVETENQRKLQELDMQHKETFTCMESRIRELEAMLAEASIHNQSLQQQLKCAQTNDLVERLRNELSEMKEAYESLQEHAKCQSREIEHFKDEQVLKMSLTSSQPNTKVEIREECLADELLHDTGSIVESAVILKSEIELTTATQSSGDLPETLQSAHERIQQQLSTIIKHEQEIRELKEELFKAKGIMQQKPSETQVKDFSCQEEQSLQTKGDPEQSPEKAQQLEKAQKMEAELQKLKMAFKKSRGELRLKVKILEDRTRELEELKEQNLNLQSDLQKTVETLVEEKQKARELVSVVKEHEKETETLKGTIQRLTVEYQTAQAELSVATEALALKSSQQCELEGRLNNSNVKLEAAMQHVQKVEHEKEKCRGEYEASTMEVQCLRDELENARRSVDSLLLEKSELLASKSDELKVLKNEVEKVSAEYESLLSSRPTQEDTEELDALNIDIQQLNAEKAELMRLKAEEVSNLQEQLEFLKDDLTKYISIADKKSKEVEFLQERLDSSQTYLDKLLGESTAMWELLLPGNEDSVEAIEKQVRECGLAESIKKLVISEKKHAEKLKGLLDKQAEELNTARQEVFALQGDMQRKDTELKQCLLSLHALLQKSDVSSEHTDDSTEEFDLVSLLAHVKVQIQALHEEKNRALQDVAHFKMLVENLQCEIESLSSRNVGLTKVYNPEKEQCDAALQTYAEEHIDVFCQTDLGHEALENVLTESVSKQEHLQNQVLALETELAELQVKQQASETQQTASVVKDHTENVKKELSAEKVKSGRMLTRLKMFKEKTEKMEKEVKRLCESNKELEERCAEQERLQSENVERKTMLEDHCEALKKEVASRVPQCDYDKISKDFSEALKRLHELEGEKDTLSDRVQSLDERNRQLEVEAAHLVSQLSVLKEQAEMLTSDNESFQSLVETLTHSRQALEHELRSQQEQHAKAVKELENKLLRNADDFKALENKIMLLTSEHEVLQGKYSEIVHRHRILEEQYHFACEEKDQLKQRLAELEDECSCLQKSAASLKQQAATAEQEPRGFVNALKQEHEEVKLQFYRLKLEHEKTEEKLVGAANQEQHSAGLKAQLEDANAVISSLRETSQESVQEVVGLRQETERLKNALTASQEQFNERESKWIEEKNQLKHNEEHLNEAARRLSVELQELKVQHEEALHSKLLLRGEIEELQKEKKSLGQQVQNWRSYIKDIESNQSSSTGDSVVTHLKRELEQTTKTLNQIGLQNETLIADLNKALEDKRQLQQQLADTQGSLHARESQILQLHSNIASSSDSCIINMSPTSQPELQQKLVELQQANEILLGNWRLEQQRRRLIEDELDSSVQRQSLMPLCSQPSESHPLLREGVVKIPETNYSITRQFKSHAYKLRRWFQGRQSTSTSSVLHI